MKSFGLHKISLYHFLILASVMVCSYEYGLEVTLVMGLFFFVAFTIPFLSVKYVRDLSTLIRKPRERSGRRLPERKFFTGTKDHVLVALGLCAAIILYFAAGDFWWQSLSTGYLFVLITFGTQILWHRFC